MLNNVFCDGAVIQRVVDVLAYAGFFRRIVNGNVNNDILAVEDLFLFDTDKRAQTKVFYTNNSVRL